MSAQAGPPSGGGVQPRAARLLLGIALAALAAYAALFAVHAAALVRFPFEADYGEGPLLYQIGLLAHGRSIYRGDGSPPYTVANYPPLYPAAVALLHLLGWGAGPAAGRALSAASIFAAAALCGLTVRAVGASRLAAAFAAGLLLAQNFVWQWGALQRVDSLALALGAAGLYAVARRPERAARAWPWFVLAVLTRQSSVEGLAAAVWALWPDRRGQALRLLGCWAAALAVVVAALQAATGGQFLVQTVLDNANAWRPGLLWSAVSGWVFTGGGLPLLAFAVWGWRLSRGLAGGRLLRGYAVAAWVLAATSGKVGASLNYFLPSIAASAMLGALCAQGRRQLTAAVLLCAYAIGIPPASNAPGPAGAVARALTAYRDLGTPGYNRLGWTTPADGLDPAQAALYARLRAMPGPILSENMSDLVLAGHPIYFQPFEMTQVLASGRWSDAPLLAAAAAGAFPLVVLEFPLDEPAQWDLERWPPGLLAALAERYVPAGRRGAYYLYEPAASSG